MYYWHVEFPADEDDSQKMRVDWDAAETVSPKASLARRLVDLASDHPLAELLRKTDDSDIVYFGM